MVHIYLKLRHIFLLGMAAILQRLHYTNQEGGLMRNLVVLVLVFVTASCSKQTVMDSRSSTGGTSSLDVAMDDEVYQVRAEDGVFVTEAIQADELDVMSQEFVATFTSTLPIKSAAQPETAKATEALKTTETAKPVETIKPAEAPKSAEIAKPLEAPNQLKLPNQRSLICHSRLRLS